MEGRRCSQGGRQGQLLESLVGRYDPVALSSGHPNHRDGETPLPLKRGLRTKFKFQLHIPLGICN